MAKRLHLDELNDDRDLSARAAYEASKLENIQFTTEQLRRRFYERG